MSLRTAAAAAIVLAVVVPIAVLRDTPPEPIPRPAAVQALATPAALDRVLARQLFVDPDDAPPRLLGIVGRLTHGGVALVRDGAATRTLRTGDSSAGWTLIALGPMQAVFARDGERRVVTLPVRR